MGRNALIRKAIVRHVWMFSIFYSWILPSKWRRVLNMPIDFINRIPRSRGKSDGIRKREHMPCGCDPLGQHRVCYCCNWSWTWIRVGYLVVAYLLSGFGAWLGVRLIAYLFF